MFKEHLIRQYLNLIPTKYKEISQIGKYNFWYLSDSTSRFIASTELKNRKIIEIDIKEAFPSLCKVLFPDKVKLINDINNTNDKFTKNKIIAIELKKSDQLRLLHHLSKVIILGLIFEYSHDITILEIKKDSCIFICDKFDKDKLFSGPYANFLLNNNLNFHIRNYSNYIRHDRTTVLMENNNIIIKGQFKKRPNKLRVFAENYLNGNSVNLYDLKNIYTKRYFEIIQDNKLGTLFDDYYKCEDKIIVNNKYCNFKYFNYITPREYLKLFIYPIILSIKTI